MHVREVVRRLLNEKFVVIDEYLFPLNSMFRAGEYAYRQDRTENNVTISICTNSG